MQVVYVLVDAMHRTVRPDSQHVIRVIVQSADAEIAHAVVLERSGFRFAFPGEDDGASLQLMAVAADVVGNLHELPLVFGFEPVVGIMQAGLNIPVDACALADQIIFVRFLQMEDGAYAPRHHDGCGMLLLLTGLTVGVGAIAFDERLPRLLAAESSIRQSVQCFLLQVDFLNQCQTSSLT